MCTTLILPILEFPKAFIMECDVPCHDVSVVLKIGSMDYKLELRLASCEPLVLHVSFLTKATCDNILVQTIVLDINEEGEIILEPETMVEARTKQVRN